MNLKPETFKKVSVVAQNILQSGDDTSVFWYILSGFGALGLALLGGLGYRVWQNHGEIGELKRDLAKTVTDGECEARIKGPYHKVESLRKEGKADHTGIEDRLVQQVHYLEEKMTDELREFRKEVNGNIRGIHQRLDGSQGKG